MQALAPCLYEGRLSVGQWACPSPLSLWMGLLFVFGTPFSRKKLSKLELLLLDGIARRLQDAFVNSLIYFPSFSSAPFYALREFLILKYLK